MEVKASYLCDEDIPQDEVQEIKRAMREAQARKRLLTARIQAQEKRRSSDHEEVSSMLRERSDQLERTKQHLTDVEMQLREANFDKKQLETQLDKVRGEKELIERKSGDVIAELERSLSMERQETANRMSLAGLECDKILRTISALYSAAFDPSENMGTQIIRTPRTARQLLDRIVADIESLKVSVSGKSTTTVPTQQTARCSDSGYDQALLDMCRNLEEENKTLVDSVNSLKSELVKSKKDSSAQQLIPHYRLAIIRSRTYAANLQEQIRREQETSRTLSEQLNETYADLKKVVEEKRQLYLMVSKQNLVKEEKEVYVEEKLSATDPIDEMKSAPELKYSSEPVVEGSNYLKDTAASKARADSIAAESRHSKDRKMYESLINNSHEGFKQRKATSRSQSPEREEVKSFLQTELRTLDQEIDHLKEKLSRAALLKTQRIVRDVLDANASHLQDVL